jgi:hypothetical protein
LPGYRQAGQLSFPATKKGNIFSFIRVPDLGNNDYYKINIKNAGSIWITIIFI